MRFASSILSSQQVPLSKSGLYIPRSSYLIDPEQAARSLGGYDKYRESIDTAKLLQDFADNQTIDSGAYAIDQALSRLGLTTNIAGARKRPVRISQLADDAVYKRQTVAPKAKQGGGSGTDVEFIRLAQTPMMDWDTPHPSHFDANVTVRHLGDVEDLARSYVQQHPESTLQLYATPGGYRAWEMGETMTPKEFQPRFDELNVDPDYARLSTMSTPLEPMGFASRISHKPGRTDWVAQPIMTLRGKDSTLNPRSAQLVSTLHDEPILRNYLTHNGASPDAVKALMTTLPNASSALQKELIRRFNL